MTLLHRFALFALASLTAGCAALSPYSISERTLEGYLEDEIESFDRAQLEAGSPLSVSFDTVDLELGPDGRDVVVLDLAGQVALNAFLARLPVDIALKVEGTPVYDSTEKAIYVRRLKLLESRIDSPFISRDLKPVTDKVMRLIAQMLETVPVYRLNEADLGPQLMDMMDLNIEVAPGRLVFVPADES